MPRAGPRADPLCSCRRRFPQDDLSRHEDIFFSLLPVAQLVIDIAGELASRDGHPFADCAEAVKNLKQRRDSPSSRSWWIDRSGC